MFRRDEVDLLEEDIDDIYDLHESISGRVQTMEQVIIAEQLDTEEQADSELAMQMDLKWLMNPRAEKPLWESHNDRVNQEDDLVCDTQRPPFYEQLFRYADQVFIYASDAYARKGHSKEHAFRVRVNIKMVPIKCAIALSEETHDDPLSIALAKKEFSLAIVYLERILISLAFMAAEGDDQAHAFLAPGTQIKRHLQQYLTRLLNNRRGFTQGYE